MLITERLCLRPLRREDYPNLRRQLQDPRVMYAYEHGFTDREVGEWLDRQLRRYQEDGFGLWAVERRDTGEWIGQAGLTWQPAEGKRVLEIGYLLCFEHWHRGYATEAAAACRDYAFQVLRAPAVFSLIKTDNEPSKRVAEAIGLHRLKTIRACYWNGERPHDVYSLNNPYLNTCNV